MGKQLLIKPEKCLGCRTCELVCSFGHNGAFNPRFANVSVMAYEEAAISVPMMCMQCEEPLLHGGLSGRRYIQGREGCCYYQSG